MQLEMGVSLNTLQMCDPNALPLSVTKAHVAVAVIPLHSVPSRVIFVC